MGRCGETSARLAACTGTGFVRYQRICLCLIFPSRASSVRIGYAMLVWRPTPSLFSTSPVVRLFAFSHSSTSAFCVWSTAPCFCCFSEFQSHFGQVKASSGLSFSAVAPHHGHFICHLPVISNFSDAALTKS